MIFKCVEKLKESEKVDGFARRLLEEEGPGILAQLLRWRAIYQKEGLHRPTSLIAIRDRYLDESDKLRSFLLEKGTFDPSARERKLDMYNAYRSWCGESGHKCEGRNEFYRRVEDHELFNENGCAYRKERLEPGRAHDPENIITGWRLDSFTPLDAEDNVVPLRPPSST